MNRRWLIVVVGLIVLAPLALACNAILGLDDPTVDSEAGNDDGAPVSDAPSLPDDSATVPREGGHCTNVRGPCDLVLQDCPANGKGVAQECIVTGTGASLTTECVLVQASQKIALGAPCCSGGDNPCKPGLSCVGPTCAQSGNVLAGRCAPFCCPSDDTSCGASVPEGIPGKCDVSLVEGAIPIGNVCAYRTDCVPFGILPCQPTEICILEQEAGAHCLTSIGKKERERCSFANDCADGQVCTGGTTGLCRASCLVPGATTPLDAGALDGAPGSGGCPDDELCTVTFIGLPAWFGVCAYADGG